MSEQLKQGLYLYCLADSNYLTEVKGAGIDDKNDLFLKHKNGIALVLSQVALDDFVGSEAEERLQDINWIGPKALCHQDIVTQIMASSPILPARFGTIFSTEDEMDILLDLHTQTIKEFLEKIHDHQEWSIKGYLDKKNYSKSRQKQN
ncbi:MAG: GvpL/GvpF family gas vesicle protein [Candidatus Magnetoglobus multicellularis str. Araruama]|uniref:GvpL/GvpF family gas vesicle protein n=1 Tax=Candidatus Magnetoglobus multicellularis str. Araruama TaxID=890399 RepID=A0A1V1PGW8_9BACT|nr:MAG: GvpL/GvpF family gas vesicle protein [Candidatus Magnetoglobus multicellularis str. Araruama]